MIIYYKNKCYQPSVPWQAIYINIVCFLAAYIFTAFGNVLIHITIRNGTYDLYYMLIYNLMIIINLSIGVWIYLIYRKKYGVELLNWYSLLLTGALAYLFFATVGESLFLWACREVDEAVRMPLYAAFIPDNVSATFIILSNISFFIAFLYVKSRKRVR